MNNLRNVYVFIECLDLIIGVNFYSSEIKQTNREHRSEVNSFRDLCSSLHSALHSF